MCSLNSNELGSESPKDGEWMNPISYSGGYSDTGLIKALLHYVWSDQMEFEEIPFQSISQKVASLQLDTGIIFNSTGVIINTKLPECFQPSQYRNPRPATDSVFTPGCYAPNNKMKDFGTDRILVKIFDGVVLNRFILGNPIIGGIEVNPIPLIKFIEACRFYLIGNEKEKTGIIAVYEKDIYNG